MTMLKSPRFRIAAFCTLVILLSVFVGYPMLDDFCSTRSFSQKQQLSQQQPSSCGANPSSTSSTMSSSPHDKTESAALLPISSDKDSLLDYLRNSSLAFLPWVTRDTDRALPREGKEATPSSGGTFDNMLGKRTLEQHRDNFVEMLDFEKHTDRLILFLTKLYFKYELACMKIALRLMSSTAFWKEILNVLLA